MFFERMREMVEAFEIYNSHTPRFVVRHRSSLSLLLGLTTPPQTRFRVTRVEPVDAANE